MTQMCTHVLCCKQSAFLIYATDTLYDTYMYIRIILQAVCKRLIYAADARGRRMLAANYNTRAAFIYGIIIIVIVIVVVFGIIMALIVISISASSRCW